MDKRIQKDKDFFKSDEFFKSTNINPHIQPNPDSLPLIEESSLHNIVLRVRDWQNIIERKFGKGSYKELENTEINQFKQELLNKGELDENGNPDDRFYDGVEYKMRRFHLVRDTHSKKFLDISIFLEWDRPAGNKKKDAISFKKVCFHNWDLIEDIERERDINGYFIKKLDISKPDFSFQAKRLITEIGEDKIKVVYNYALLFFQVAFNKIPGWLQPGEPEEVKQLTFNGQLLFFECWFYGNTEFEGCLFNEPVLFIRSSFLKDSSFGNSIFKKDVLFGDCLFINGSTTIHRCIFESNVIFNAINIWLNSTFSLLDSLFLEETCLVANLDSNLYLGNPNEDKKIKVRGKIRRLGKLFENISIDLSVNIVKKLGNDPLLKISHASFTNFERQKKLIRYFNSMVSINGKKVAEIDWKTCDPKPFQKVLSFKSESSMMVFMKDFVSAFEQYIRVRQTEEIFVNIESISGGYNIVIDSDSETLINEISNYKEDFEDFLKNPQSQFSKINKGIDSLESQIELMSLFSKIIFKLQAYKNLIVPLGGETAFVLPSSEITGQLIINMPNITNDFTNTSFNNSQLIQADNVFNPSLNAEPSLQELIILLDDIQKINTSNSELTKEIKLAKNELEGGREDSGKNILSRIINNPNFQNGLALVANSMQIISCFVSR